MVEAAIQWGLGLLFMVSYQMLSVAPDTLVARE